MNPTNMHQVGNMNEYRGETEVLELAQKKHRISFVLLNHRQPYCEPNHGLAVLIKGLAVLGSITD